MNNDPILTALFGATAFALVFFTRILPIILILVGYKYRNKNIVFKFILGVGVCWLIYSLLRYYIF